ncbi:MAG TPA: hypothetical protein VJO35_00175 [Terriglobales bacterium]|nr:hypothetical protein [Terriglobales bacterium]
MNCARVPADDPLRIKGTAVPVFARIIVVVCMILAGCGSNPGAPAGFLNLTKHSDAHLWVLWRTAQHRVAEQIDLNPLEQQLNNAPANIVAGDPRALGISPHQVKVSSQPDISSAILYASTGTMHSDPTGLIACPQPCNLDYAPAYSLYNQPSSSYAASWEFAGNNFDQLVEYEFENQILSALGYDMRWR